MHEFHYFVKSDLRITFEGPITDTDIHNFRGRKNKAKGVGRRQWKWKGRGGGRKVISCDFIAFLLFLLSSLEGEITCLI